MPKIIEIKTLIVKVIVENVVTCFWGGHSVDYRHSHKKGKMPIPP